jgi:hypothetical protein
MTGLANKDGPPDDITGTPPSVADLNRSEYDEPPPNAWDLRIGRLGGGPTGKFLRSVAELAR